MMRHRSWTARLRGLGTAAALTLSAVVAGPGQAAADEGQRYWVRQVDGGVPGGW
ncbi:hypothetical protein ACN2WE_22040 [Streptomyces sp. cg28]|uniref:hypothetical protein n=1 Tax=Streptomyces sp. cg28 TaxID=3403457 RepID=UPI003B22448A